MIVKCILMLSFPFLALGAPVDLIIPISPSLLEPRKIQGPRKPTPPTPPAPAAQSQEEAPAEEPAAPDEPDTPTIVEKSQVQILDDDTVNIENVAAPTVIPVIALPFTAWQTDRPTIVGILEGLPSQYTSPQFHKIAQSLLNAGLEAPKSKNPLEDRNLLLIRAQKLNALGHPQDAFALLETHRSMHMAPLYLELSFQNALMKKEIDKACTLAVQQAKTSPAPYWEKALATCQILQGQLDAARLSLSVIAENNHPSNKAFIAACQLILEPDLSKNMDPLENPDVLTLLLLNSSKVGLSPDVLAKISSAVRGYLVAALSPLNVKKDDKLGLMEEATENGFLEGPELKKAYVAYLEAHPELAKVDKAALLARAQENSSAIRALLLNKVLTEPDEFQKMLFLKALLKNGKKHALYRAISRALAEFFASIKPDQGHADLTDDLLPALLLTQKDKSTCNWRHYVNLEKSPETLPILLAGCPQMEGSVRDKFLTQWYAELEKKNGGNTPVVMQYAADVLTLLESLGTSVPLNLWEKVAALPTAKTLHLSAAKKALIVQGIHDKKSPETLGRLLTLFGSSSDLWTPENIAFLLAQLRALHLGNLATEIGTEMLMTLQPPQGKTLSAE